MTDLITGIALYFGVFLTLGVVFTAVANYVERCAESAGDLYDIDCCEVQPETVGPADPVDEALFMDITDRIRQDDPQWAKTYGTWLA